jgi:hypothetical protein
VQAGYQAAGYLDRERITCALLWLVFAAGLEATGCLPPRNLLTDFILLLSLLWAGLPLRLRVCACVYVSKTQPLIPVYVSLVP